MEHSALSLENTLNYARACRGFELASFIRVRSAEPSVVTLFLELHPAGVIIPRISNITEAEATVWGCRYSPAGARGFGPARGARFGRRSTEEYLAAVDSELIVVLQIEHIDAVEQIDEILDIPGLGSIVPGPMDLSGSRGLLGQPDHPDVVAGDRSDAGREPRQGSPHGPVLGF